MNFKIIEQKDESTGKLFFDVYQGGGRKKRFQTKAAAKLFIQEQEHANLITNLFTLLESIERSFGKEYEEPSSDDTHKLKPR